MFAELTISSNKGSFSVECNFELSPKSQLILISILQVLGLFNKEYQLLYQLMFKKLRNIGDCGIVCDFGDEVNQKINAGVIKLFHHVKKQVSKGNLKGILNYTPSYNKLIIDFDLEKINSSKIIDFLQSVDFSQLNFPQNKKDWIIPICYDFGMDLENMSKTLKIDIEEIKNIHLNTTFYIYMVGFIPGHPFMGDLDSKLFLNRLKTPRVKIPPGSVGIVEKFCNIYPYESPGGWNIIGRTPTKLFNKKDNSNPCLLSPGDSVKFKSISKKEFEKLNNEQ
jgi:KipI family sensor histidine kinase inhibitor